MNASGFYISTYGVKATEIVQTTRQILLKSKVSTCGKSATAPITIRAKVLTIPIIDKSEEA